MEKIFIDENLKSLNGFINSSSKKSSKSIPARVSEVQNKILIRGEEYDEEILVMDESQIDSTNNSQVMI